MEFFDAKVQLGAVRVAADFVYGHQRVVHVKRRVFQSLGHHRSGELLPAHNEIKIVLLALLQVPGGLHKEYATEKREGRPIARNRDRILYTSAVRFRNPRVPDVGPVDRQTRCHRDKRVFQLLGPQISCMPIFLRQLRQAAHERIDLAGEQFFHHLTLSFAKDFGKRPVRAREFRIDLFEPVKAFGIDECPVDEIEEVIACGSVRIPVEREQLVSGKYALDDDVDRGQPIKIALGVPQAVNVIDPQASHLAVCNELEHVGVSRLKNILPFNAQTDEIADIEKSPIVDGVGCLTPERQPVMLPGKNLIHGSRT